MYISMELYHGDVNTCAQLLFYKKGNLNNSVNVEGNSSKIYNFIPNSEDVTLQIRVHYSGANTVTLYLKDY